MKIIDSKETFLSLFNNDYRFAIYKNKIYKSYFQFFETDNKNLLSILINFSLYFFIGIFFSSFFIILNFCLFKYENTILTNITYLIVDICFIYFFYLFFKDLNRINNFYKSFEILLNKINFNNNINKEEFLNILKLLSFDNKLEYEILLVNKEYVTNKIITNKYNNLNNQVILIKFKNDLYWEVINYKDSMLDGITYSKDNVIIKQNDLFKNNKDDFYLEYDSSFSFEFKTMYFICLFFFISLSIVFNNINQEKTNNYTNFIIELKKEFDKDLIFVKNEENKYIINKNDSSIKENINNLNDLYKTKIIENVNKELKFQFYDLKNEFNQKQKIISKDNFEIISIKRNNEIDNKKIDELIDTKVYDYYFKNKITNDKINIEKELYKEKTEKINIFKYLF